MFRSRLKKYAKNSDLLEIDLSYDGKSFKFNLFQELVINEDIINDQIKLQPALYSFLAMLHKRLIRTAADKELSMDKAYAKAFVKFKQDIDSSTGRATSKELAKEQSQCDPRYEIAVKAYNKAKEQLGIIETCVKSFEQRKDILQTLSANRRKEI